jgi:hypothetical protein
MLLKKIPGFELYEVSPKGDIVSLKSGLLKRHYNDKGYQQAFLYKDKKRHCIKVHGVVASLYVSNTNQHKEVNHIDGNKKNNHYTNLEWCSRLHNIRHAIKTGLFNPAANGRFGNCTGVLNKETKEVYKSIAEASRKTGLTYKQVYRRLKIEGSNFSTI